VTTTAISNIATTTADSGGNVTADGGDPVTVCGVCWNTGGTPTTADSKTTDGTGTGVFTSNITGLSSNTTYHARAYATNGAGTTYGNEVSFATTPPPDPEPGEEDIADEDGMAEVANEDAEATVNGAEPGTPVALVTNAAGKITLTVGGLLTIAVDVDEEDTSIHVEIDDSGNRSATTLRAGGIPLMYVLIQGFEEDDSSTVAIESGGTATIVTTDAAGDDILTLHADSWGRGARIIVTMNESGDPSVFMARANGSSLTVNARQYPSGIEIHGTRDPQDNIAAGITDNSGTARTVLLAAIGADRDIVIDVIHNTSAQEAGWTAPRTNAKQPAGNYDMSDVNSVTLEAVGLLGSAVIRVAFAYVEADYAGGEESELRLLRLDDETGQYVPAGTTDMGDSAPTDTLGDYGIDTEAKTVWAQVNELGTFALTPLQKDDHLLIITRGPRLCGILGIVSLSGLLLVMGVWSLVRHKASIAP
jgi:hypothetical protein